MYIHFIVLIGGECPYPDFVYNNAQKLMTNITDVGCGVGTATYQCLSGHEYLKADVYYTDAFKCEWKKANGPKGPTPKRYTMDYRTYDQQCTGK